MIKYIIFGAGWRSQIHLKQHLLYPIFCFRYLYKKQIKKKAYFITAR